MVQIKDSVLRDSGVPPGCFPASSRYAHLLDAAPAVRHDCPSGVGNGKAFRTAFLAPDDDSDCQQLVNNLSRELYVVDFRRVVRGSKKVRIFREIGLTFQKVVQGSRNNGTIQRASSKRGEKSAAVFPRKPLCARDLRAVVPFGPDRLRTVSARAGRGIVNKF